MSDRLAEIVAVLMFSAAFGVLTFVGGWGYHAIHGWAVDIGPESWADVRGGSFMGLFFGAIFAAWIMFISPHLKDGATTDKEDTR